MWHKINLNLRDIKMVKKEHAQIFIHNKLGFIHTSNNIYKTFLNEYKCIE